MIFDVFCEIDELLNWRKLSTFLFQKVHKNSVFFPEVRQPAIKLLNQNPEARQWP